MGGPFGSYAPVKVLLKSTDGTPVNNSTVLVNVTELVLPVGEYDVWLIEAFVLFDSGAVPDIKFAWAIPAGGSGRRRKASLETGYYTWAQELVVSSSATRLYREEGVYIGGGTAGNVQLQMAQAVADVSDTKVLKNSFVLCRKLSGTAGEVVV